MVRLQMLCLLALFLSSASVALALETFPPSDPRSVIQIVIDLTDRHALPSWDDATFGARLRPYLSDDFLATIARGARIAKRKSINLYDGEFFTGSQDLAHAKLMQAGVIELSGDAATVEAKVATSDKADVAPTVGSRIRYQLKRVKGAWRIDDFRDLEDYAKSQPSVKTLFGDPVRYGQ